MNRNFNTRHDGASFDEDTIRAVWEKGQADSVFGFKKDVCGVRMQRSKYGKMESQGWEIDHIKPVAKGGTDDLGNLQPLQWENNRHKSDNYPNWSCTIRN